VLEFTKPQSPVHLFSAFYISILYLAQLSSVCLRLYPANVAGALP
jgi:hypothetical protein